MQRKCCAHCPGDVTRTGEPAREHACSIPGYVAGSLRVAALTGPGARCHHQAHQAQHQPDTESPRAGSCCERFATARKFHEENLQHQPLPDRVDDAIFTVDKPAENPYTCDVVKRCQRIVPRRQVSNRKKELNRVHRYAPALGCKKPTTYMDLAICWETPIDASYEPRRPIHIDGSDGGPAPAIFTLVQHAESQVDVRDGCIPGHQQRTQQPGNECCAASWRCDKCAKNSNSVDAAVKDELCKNLDSIRLTAAAEEKAREPGGVGAAARRKRAEFLQHCATTANDAAALAATRKSANRRPAARSASGLQKSGCAVVARKNNGLPGRVQVPRPRTPYARRSFCIDSLAPPFSVVNGCRDADYPEHWRLTSIYQQSYRNPRKMREGRTLLNYDRSYR